MVTFSATSLFRVIGEVLTDGVSKRKLPRLGQLRDGHRREHLVHRSKVELGVEVNRHFRGRIGYSGCFACYSYAIPGHQDNAGKLLLCCQ
jgi:hypothetical protein